MEIPTRATASRARHLLLPSLPLHNLTTLSTGTTLCSSKKARIKLFFFFFFKAADVFLFFPSSPRGNQCVRKPINTLLPEKGAWCTARPRAQALQTPRCWDPAAADACCPSRCLPQQGHLCPPRAPLPALAPADTPSCLLELPPTGSTPPAGPWEHGGAGRAARPAKCSARSPSFPARRERSHSERKGRPTCYPRAAARALRTEERSCKINGFLVRALDTVLAWSGSRCSEGSCTYPQSSSSPAPLTRAVLGRVPSPQTKRRASRTPRSQTPPQHPPPAVTAALRGLGTGQPGGSLPTQGLHQQVGLTAEPNVSDWGDAGLRRLPKEAIAPRPPSPSCTPVQRQPAGPEQAGAAPSTGKGSRGSSLRAPVGSHRAPGGALRNQGNPD